MSRMQNASIAPKGRVSTSVNDMNDGSIKVSFPHPTLQRRVGFRQSDPRYHMTKYTIHCKLYIAYTVLYSSQTRTIAIQNCHSSVNILLQKSDSYRFALVRSATGAAMLVMLQYYQI